MTEATNTSRLCFQSCWGCRYFCRHAGQWSLKAEWRKACKVMECKQPTDYLDLGRSLTRERDWDRERPERRRSFDLDRERLRELVLSFDRCRSSDLPILQMQLCLRTPICCLPRPALVDWVLQQYQLSQCSMLMSAWKRWPKSKIQQPSL